jgi:flavin-binding protein dodecin
MNTQLKAIYEQGITEANESIERAIAARAAKTITDEVYYARIQKWDNAIYEYQTKLQELGA